MNNEDLQMAKESQKCLLQANIVQQALAQLTPQERSCLLLYADAEFSQEEIATIVELDSEATKRILSQAYQRFWYLYMQIKKRQGIQIVSQHDLSLHHTTRVNHTQVEENKGQQLPPSSPLMIGIVANSFGASSIPPSAQPFRTGYTRLVLHPGRVRRETW